MSETTSTPTKRPRTDAERAELASLLVERDRRAAARAKAEREAAEAKRLAALETADLMRFMPLVSPDYHEPLHLAPVVDLFERVLRGECIRACVSVPTQHGKTETVLHGLAYLLKHRPSWPMIYSTYQQDQSEDKSHRARAIARSAIVELAPDRQNLAMWRTSSGGGMVFTSVRGPGSGQPAVLCVLDDPYKDRAAAMSPAIRRDVRNHFSSVLMQRGQEGMSLLVVHTRWEEVDLIGDIERGEFGPRSKIRGDGGWEIVNLPMLALDDGSPAPRPYTTATRVLNPRRSTADGRGFGWTLEGAITKLQNTPERDAESMMQGRPRSSKDGALWTWSHITPWRVEAEPERSRCEVFVDPNASTDANASKADDAGIVTIARGIDGRGYVLDDSSGHVGVDGWPARAVAAYRAHQAHSICAEADGGGAMVEKTIRAWLMSEALEKSRATGKHVAPEPIVIRLVKVAARGDKRGRCETVRELYGDPETGRPSVVSHVGTHNRLERSMTSHDFATNNRSPGDLDALSLGLWELLLTKTNTVVNDTPPASVGVEINEGF